MNESNQIRDGPIQIKLLLLGDGRVGKTSLRKQYLGVGFPEEYLETLGADFSIKTVQYKEFSIRYNIWDIAGQPKFHNIRKGFFTGARAGLILYDITIWESKRNLSNWIEEFLNNSGTKSIIPIIVIGNKIDLREETSIENISSKEGKKEVDKLKKKFKRANIQFLETSAKTGKNVELAFELITKEYLEINKIS